MLNKRILRLTNQEALIKIDGPIGTTTINLGVDLLLPTEELHGPLDVSILMMKIAGRAGGLATITRGGAQLWDLQANAAEEIDLLALGSSADNTNASTNIVVTTSIAETQLLLKLRKNSGYRTLIRPEQTGLPS